MDDSGSHNSFMKVQLAPRILQIFKQKWTSIATVSFSDTRSMVVKLGSKGKL